MWFRGADEDGNKAQDSLPRDGLKVKKSEELLISDIKCIGQSSDKCEGTLFDKEIKIELNTLGGVDGTSGCTWNRGEGEVEFFEGQGTSVHTQPGYNLKKGENRITIKCYDKAGNTAMKNLVFNYEKDEKSPKILKIYRDSGKLAVNTDEISTCKYSLNQTFDFGTENKLDSGNNLEHYLAADNNYYKIGCMDRFGNVVGPFSVYIQTKNE